MINCGRKTNQSGSDLRLCKLVGGKPKDEQRTRSEHHGSGCRR